MRQRMRETAEQEEEDACGREDKIAVLTPGSDERLLQRAWMKTHTTGHDVRRDVRNVREELE